MHTRLQPTPASTFGSTFNVQWSDTVLDTIDGQSPLQDRQHSCPGSHRLKLQVHCPPTLSLTRSRCLRCSGGFPLESAPRVFHRCFWTSAAGASLRARRHCHSCSLRDAADPDLTRACCGFWVLSDRIRRRRVAAVLFWNRRIKGWEDVPRHPLPLDRRQSR